MRAGSWGGSSGRGLGGKGLGGQRGGDADEPEQWVASRWVWTAASMRAALQVQQHDLGLEQGGELGPSHGEVGAGRAQRAAGRRDERGVVGSPPSGPRVASGARQARDAARIVSD